MASRRCPGALGRFAASVQWWYNSAMVRPILSFLMLVLLAAALGGCVTLPDPEAGQAFSGDVVGTVGAGHTVGQTVVSRRPRFNGVDLWLVASDSLPDGELLLEIYRRRYDVVPLASARLVSGDVIVGQPLRLLFAPQDDPPGQAYYLQLTTNGEPLDVLGRNEDAYPLGQAWLDGEPLDADLAFRLLYDYDATAMFGDLLGWLSRGWLALPLAVLLLLPGWLLLDLSGLRGRFDGGEQAAMAAGLSVALVPLALLWTTVLGLRWSRSAVLAVAGLLAVATVWRLLRRGVHRPRLDSPGWLLLGIFALSLAVRLAMVRDLAAPAWVDSVHHALVAQMIVDQGLLPASYEPFVSADTASYHAGFQGLVAAFHWLSGLDVAGAMLLVGQVLNALMVPAAYLFARELTGDRVVGLVAALVVGVFSPMPAYYASWGRYTQLAGLLILPAALALSLRLAQSHRTASSRLDQSGKRYLTLAALALAGLLLTHYRVAAFYVCFLAACPVADWRRWKIGLPRWGLIVGAAALLTLPWLIPAMATFWLPSLTAWAMANPATYRDFAWRYLTLGQGKYVLVLGVLGLGWAAVQRQRLALVLAVWVAFMFLLASLGPLGWPGANFVNYTSVEITLFLPLSVLVGYVFSRLLAAWREALRPQWLLLYRGVIAVLGVGLALFGALTLLPILNVDTVLFWQADRSAMEWLRESLPEEALVLVNPMAWSAHLYAGRDGGYWISPLAGRRTLPPNALYGLGAPEDVLAVNELCAAVLEQGHEPDALWPLLRDWGVTHVYLGARGGALSTRALSDSESYRPIYAQDGASVFEVLARSP